MKFHQRKVKSVSIGKSLLTVGLADGRNSQPAAGVVSFVQRARPAERAAW